MGLSLFSKWAIDPNGWGRHMFVGCLFLIGALISKRVRPMFIALVILAIAKEIFDAVWGMGRLVIANALPDILFTVSPFIVTIFKSSTKQKKL